MPEESTSPLEKRLHQAIDSNKRQGVVVAFCKRCNRIHYTPWCPGIKADSSGTYNVMCLSCLRICATCISTAGPDIRGQMLIPGLLDDDLSAALSVPSTRRRKGV